MPRNPMSPDERGHGFAGRQGGDVQRHLPPLFYTYIGRKLRAKAKRRAHSRALRITEKMKKTGRIEFADDRAETVFVALVEIVETKLTTPKEGHEGVYEYKAKDRIAAASKVLEFAQVKPVTKVENVIKTAEDWLSTVDNDGAE